MSTYKLTHTGERVDNAVSKIPESLPTEDSLIVVKADGSASEYVPRSQVSSDKLDKQTAQTTSDQIYGKLADGSQTMFDVTMGAEPTTIPRRDTAGRIQVADGVSGSDAVNFNQLSAVESSVINSLDKEHIAYVNKENTFTKRQKFDIPYNSEDNTSYDGYIDASAVKVSKIKYDGGIDTGRTTNNEAILTSESLKLTRRINTQNGTDQRRIQLDLDGIKKAEYVNHVLANYAYIFPKTYPNKEVTLATIEDLTAQLDTKLDKAGGTISGSLIIAENLTVQGKTTSVDTQNLKVADKLIYVAKDNTIALTSPAGLITPKYDGTNNGGIVYDHTGTAYVGDITLDSNGNVDVNNSDLQPIATRNATITNGNLVKWNNAAKKLVDSGKAIDDLSTATNLENGSGDHSIVQKVIPSSTSDPNNYATGKEAVSLGRYSITKADRAMTVNYDNKNYGKWSFVANKSNRVGSENGNQDDVQSNAVFGEGNIIEKGIEGFVSGKSNINYEGDRFNLSGSENKNHTNLTRMSGWKNESLEELKTAIPSGGGGTPPDVPPVEPTNPFDYTSVLGYNDISGNENKVFAMGASTRGVAGVCYSPFGSTEGFWTKAGYIVEKERKDGYIYYKPQGLGAKAFGAGTWAKEDYTVAGGQQTQALKKGSIALGLGTIAKSEWSTMIGKYNVGYSDSVFEVGNGFSANDRSNLLTLYSDGRLVNKDGKAFITDINKTDWAHEGAADAGKILMLDSTGNLLLTNADNPTLSSHLVNKKFVQEYVAEHGTDNLNIENGTGNALVQTTDSNHSFKVMADGRAKVQTAPVDTDDVVRKLELDNVNARYVSTSILGG